MLISQALQEAVDTLRRGGIDNPALDAEVLISHILDIDRYRLITDRDKDLSPEQYRMFQNTIKRRLKFEPVAYIIGFKEFYSLEFAVNRDVLIPRPETELLVDLVLYYAGRGEAVLDLGTGSGAVAVSVKYNRMDLDVTATDISEKAVSTAEKNAEHILGVKCISLLRGDLFEPCGGMMFHVIVSNPPYVDKEDATLQKELFYEPAEALFADFKGHAVIDRIVSSAYGYLHDGGYLILEIGCSMKDYMYQRGEGAGFTVSVLNDYAGLPRVAVLRKKT